MYGSETQKAIVKAVVEQLETFIIFSYKSEEIFFLVSWSKIGKKFINTTDYFF
jgi:hypothetical protein